MKRTDNVLLLRRFPFGESSLVVHVLASDGRRLHLVARGAYRPKSRLFGVLDFFDTLEVTWTERAGRTGGLGEVRQADIATRRRALTRDLARYRAASSGLELASQAAHEANPEPRLFAAVERFFDLLGDPERLPILERLAFDLELLNAIGLKPALEVCASCAGPAPPVEPGRAAFSAAGGGRLCAKCAQAERAGGVRVGTLPIEVLQGAALIARTSAAERKRLPPPPVRLQHALVDFIDRFLEYHLETRLSARHISR